MASSWLGATSVLLVLAVIIFLALPKLLQRSQDTTIAAERFAEDIYLDAQTDLAGEPLDHTAAPHSRLAAPSEEPTQQREAEEPAFTIYWGRVLIFGVGVFALLTAFFTSLIALFTALSWAVPATSLLVAGACVATLRAFALHDAKKRGHYAAATRPTIEHEEIVLRPREKSQEKAPLTLENLPESANVRIKPSKTDDQVPVAFAAKSLRYARTHHQSERPVLEGTATSTPLEERRLPEEPFESAVAEWQPTPLPEPIYTDFELVRPEGQSSIPAEFTLPVPPSSSPTIVSGSSLDDILNRRRRP